LNVVLHSRLDGNDDAITVRFAAVVQPDVLDPRSAQRLHPVTPPLAVEVPEAAVPFGPQLGTHQPSEATSVPGIPRRLDVEPKHAGLVQDLIHGESRIILCRYRRRGANASLTPVHPPAPGKDSQPRVNTAPEQHDNDRAGDHDPHAGRDVAGTSAAASAAAEAASTTAAVASAEVRAPAAPQGERGTGVSEPHREPDYYGGGVQLGAQIPTAHATEILPVASGGRATGRGVTRAVS